MNTSLSISISFILGLYLSSTWFVIAQRTLMTAGVGTIHSQWAQRPLRQMDVENWQLKDTQYQWPGHWVDNLMTSFSLQCATPILGIQVFIHYRWCRKQGSQDASEKISPSVEDASHFPSSCKNLLHPPLPEWFSPPPNSKSLFSGHLTCQLLTGNFVTGLLLHYLTTTWFEDKGTRIVSGPTLCQVPYT